MKKSLFVLAALSLIACKKTSETFSTNKKDTLEIIDSINAARTRYKDSIKVLNEKKQFADLSGTHKLSFSDDDGNKLNGSVNFTKKGRDEYSVSGSANSGKNKLNIDGTIKRVSEKHLNFDGKISQNIGGAAYERSKATTFLDEGKGKYWRLQDKVNGQGFVDYIDISF